MARTRRDAPGSGTWWDTRVLLRWTAVNGAAYLVVVGAGVALETLLSGPARSLAAANRSLAILLVALLGSAWHGLVLGRWQWRILRHRLPDLDRRNWVLATFVPAFGAWLLLFAPEAVDALTGGDRTLAIFRDAFVQALVLGPLIGLGQAFALRRDTRRWAWWFLANVSTYLFGAALLEVGRLLLGALSVEKDFSAAFPLLTFAFHGGWMLWVSDPAVATPSPRPPEVSQMAELVRTNDPGLVSALEGLLGGADIPYQVADRNMSVLEGSIGAIQMRVLVPDEREAEARELLADAGLGDWLRP